MPYYQCDKEFYKGFYLTDIRKGCKYTPFSTRIGVVAKYKGRRGEIEFSGKIREVKKRIREFWEEKK